MNEIILHPDKEDDFYSCPHCCRALKRYIEDSPHEIKFCPFCGEEVFWKEPTNEFINKSTILHTLLTKLEQPGLDDYVRGYNCGLRKAMSLIDIQPIYKLKDEPKFKEDTLIQKGHEDIINGILRYYGKTREGLAADVQKTNEDFEK